MLLFCSLFCFFNGGGGFFKEVLVWVSLVDVCCCFVLLVCFFKVCVLLVWRAGVAEVRCWH